MKFTHPELVTIFDTDNGYYNTLVIENQSFLRRLLSDISNQLSGLDGLAVLSENNAIIPFSKNAALLDVFVPFEINRKQLISKIVSALEKEANAAEHYEMTAAIMRDIEVFLDRLAFSFPCDIIFSGVSVSALIKACAPEIRSTAVSLAEQVLDYMELVCEFDRRRLFFTFNMRAFVPDGEMEQFARTAIDHGYPVIAIESYEHPRLSMEKRVIVDADLCEID